MATLDKETIGFGLKLVSTFTSGMFAGCALYVNAVEHPARMTHDMTTAVTIWKPSYLRAIELNGSFAAISGASAIGSYFCFRGTSKEDIYWAVAGGVILTGWPFTMAFIMPVNKQLLETEKCIEERGESWIKQTINYWNQLHGVRTILGLSAFGMMIYRLTKS